jgi:hypothetical protein
MLVRIMAYALAAFMAFMGVQKFMGGVPIFEIIEANARSQWGLDAPWIDPWFRYFTGILEIVAAALLVAGRRLYGGALSLAVTVGAVAAHLTVLGVSTPMSAEAGAQSSPMLFIMACMALPVSALVTLTARRA